jgi:hypothetical protein
MTKTSNFSHFADRSSSTVILKMSEPPLLLPSQLPPRYPGENSSVGTPVRGYHAANKPPSVSSIRSTPHSGSERGSDDRHQLSLDPIVLSNVSVNPRRVDSAPLRHGDSDVGREVRQLVMGMQIDLARLRESVDLKHQFNKQVVTTSDSHFQAHSALMAAIAAAKSEGGPIELPPAYFLAPLPSAPLTTLRVNDSGASTAAVVFSRSNSADGSARRRVSAGDSPRAEMHHSAPWNMSTLVEKRASQSSAGAADDTGKHRVESDSASINTAIREDRSGPSGGPQLREAKPKHLRFNTATSNSHDAHAEVKAKPPLVATREQTERDMPPPNAFGKSMTGLWSQAASHGTNAADHSAHWAHAAAATGRSAGDIRPAFDALGTVSGKALGMSGGRIDSEAFARQQLERMSIERLPQPRENISALEDPIRNGVLLCRLLNYITSHAQPRKQFRELSVKVGSVECAKSNFISALTRIRELHIPSSAPPIPQAMLYLNPSDIVLRGDTSELWGLLAALIEIFVTKGYAAVASSGEGSSQPDPASAPILGRFCDTYSSRNMLRLEEAVCEFLFSLNVLVEPTEHGLPADNSGAPVPDPHHAAFLPTDRRKWHVRTTPFKTISLSSVLPYLTNGTALCDVVSKVLGVELLPFRNPRIRANCISNIRMMQNELMKHSPQRIANFFLCDAAPVYDSDIAFILLLLEDIMRLASKAPPRKRMPSETMQPYLSSSPHAAAEDGSSPGPRRNAPPIAHRLEDPAGSNSAGLSHKEVVNAQISRFHQRERQLFAGGSGGPPTASYVDVAVADPRVVDGQGSHAFRREESVGSQLQTPFTSTSAQPPPTQLRSRTAGVTTAAPSSGRSIVPSDEVRDELRDTASEPLALLPRHLEYLNTVNPDDKELSVLARWLQFKLGPSYHYASADRLLDVSGNNIQLTQPCFLFSDGLVLTHLVRILSYHKCPQLETVQSGPKTNAVKRQNVRKVVEFLRQEKKILMDYVFLEDVLVTGDLRAVVLVLRGLRCAYKNHKSPTLKS